MLKKFAFIAESFLFLSVIACGGGETTAGGTIDPNAIAEASSSSEMSSSSRVLDEDALSSSDNEANVIIESSSSHESVQSSSSLELPKGTSSSSINDGGLEPEPIFETSSSSGYNNLRAQTENFRLECKENAPDSDSPSAYYYVYNNAEVILFENVNFNVPCDKEQREAFLNSVDEAGANVGLDGNTVYVNFMRSKGLEYGCSCVADAGFRLSQYYPGLEYAVFDQQEPLQLNELHYTLNEDVQENN